MKVRNLGKRSLAEIEDKMKENGLRFKPEDAKNE
jgi:DNA-directed RNA polymerase alpha subunit